MGDDVGNNDDDDEGGQEGDHDQVDGQGRKKRPAKGQGPGPGPGSQQGKSKPVSPPVSQGKYSIDTRDITVVKKNMFKEGKVHFYTASLPGFI